MDPTIRHLLLVYLKHEPHNLGLNCMDEPLSFKYIFRKSEAKTWIHHVPYLLPVVAALPIGNGYS